MQRWGEMYLREPSAHGRRGGPPADMMHFMWEACEFRLDLLKRHLTLEEMARFQYVPEQEWQALEQAAAGLQAQGVAPGSAAVRELAARYFTLLERLVGGDGALLRKLMEAGRREPLLQAGAPLSPQVRAFLLASTDGA
jgi:hypothetical protein